MLRIGLTGSIGMGKSTTAALFAELGIPVHDADKAVHELYRQPAVVAQIEAAFPGTTDGAMVDRKALGTIVLADADAMKRLEQMIHPLVRAAESALIERAQRDGAPYSLFDIPLLFETGQQARFDAIIVVTADKDIQRARVLARDGMTLQKFDSILAKQMPDAEKRARADFIVETDKGLDDARTQVERIHESLCKRAAAVSP
ncbi:MAG: dephospho-CoA kinase [Ahrensia sp.]